MSDVRQVKPGDWIRVGSIDCVVAEVRSIDLAAADLQVVCNPERPALYDVNWEENAWSFAHPMRGGYAEHAPEMAQYVAILEKGPRPD